MWRSTVEWISGGRRKELDAEYGQAAVSRDYGFEDARKDGVGGVGHGGGAPGMNGDLRICPKPGYVVAVLANLDPPAALRISGFVDLRIPE